MTIRQQAEAEVRMCEQLIDRGDEDSIPYCMAAFKKTFAPIIKAAIGVSIDNEDIEQLEFDSSGDLIIRTSYVVYGCADGDRYVLPAHILDAEDPLRAATIHYFRRKVNEMETHVEHKKADLISAEKALARLKQDLAVAIDPTLQPFPSE